MIQVTFPLKLILISGICLELLKLTFMWKGSISEKIKKSSDYPYNEIQEKLQLYDDFP